MTPADISYLPELAIYQGAEWSHTLTFTQTSGGAPVDLSGRTFSLIARKNDAAKTLLFAGTAALLSDGLDGKVTIRFTGSQTDTLALGQASIGLRDDQNQAYLQGLVPVKYFAPDPA